MRHGKEIELFLINGTAEGIVTAELSNWNGKAVRIPRIELNEYKNEDIQVPGVYFLFCKEEDGSDSVYIGEAENVKERLTQHIRDNEEKDKYYWNTAVVFVGNDLNKASIRYLENRLVEIARESKRYLVLTKNTYRNTVMKDSQKEVMEEFIDNLRILVSTLGYKVLEPMVQKDKALNNGGSVLYLRAGNKEAKATVTTEGFVLLSGSSVNEKTAEKSLSQGVRKLRSEYLDSGKVEKWKTVEDILFSSSSAAASFVLGYQVSGPATWKDKKGTALKEIESKLAQ